MGDGGDGEISPLGAVVAWAWCTCFHSCLVSLPHIQVQIRNGPALELDVQGPPESLRIPPKRILGRHQTVLENVALCFHRGTVQGHYGCEPTARKYSHSSLFQIIWLIFSVLQYQNVPNNLFLSWGSRNFRIMLLKTKKKSTLFNSK